MDKKDTNSLKKMWCLSEYRDKCGFGRDMFFESKEEALVVAEDMWYHMDDRDKKSYLTDPAGTFWVGLVWAYYDNNENEWLYIALHDPIEIAKDFIREEKSK